MATNQKLSYAQVSAPAQSGQGEERTLSTTTSSSSLSQQQSISNPTLGSVSTTQTKPKKQAWQQPSKKQKDGVVMNNQPSHENLKFGAQDIGVGRTGSAPPTNGVPIQPQTGLVPPFQSDVVRPGNIQHYSAPPYGAPFYPQPGGVYYQNNPYYASYPAPFFPSGPNPQKPEGAPEPAFKLPVPKRTPIKIVNPNSKKEIILPTKPPTKAVSLEDVNKPKLVAIELKDPKTGERKSIDVKRPAIPIAGDAKATSPPTKKSPKKETSGEPSVQGSPTMSTASKPVITVSEKVVVVATTTATSPTRGKSPTKGGIGTQSVDKPVAKMIPKHSSTLSPKPIEAKEVSMKPLEAKNATVKIEGKVEPKVESKAVESKQVVQKIELKMPDAKVRVLESSNEPARISSSDTLKVDEKLEVFESPSAIEPGEIRELDYSTVSPLTIEQMSKIEYPPDLSRPKMVDGKITYNFDFFKAFEKMDLPLPKGLPDLTVMYGPEINKGLSSKGGVDMSRGSSYQGSRRNDRGGNSKFSKGLSRSQQSSRQSTARPPKSLHAPALVRGENAWNPGKKQDLSENEKTIKLARGLLNKLALDNFDRVSNKILDLDIVNDEILAAIVQLISEKAIGEVTFCAMYAKLCLKMVQVLPTKQEWIVSDANKNAFRQLLLKSCQAKFETDDKWSEGDLIAQKARVEMLKNIDKWTAEEKQEFAEQAYERQKIKMKSLGNIKFVGELYLVGLLSEKIIIDECLGKLIKKGLENNEEEDLEALCKLMVSVGQRLDSPRNQEKMNGYFTCLETLSKIESVSSRVKFMLQDVIDLRKDRWVPRVTATVSAKSLAQVQQEIREDSKKKANASKPSRRETDRYDRRPDSKGSGGFERDNRDRKRPEKQRSEDGWTSAGAGSKPANKDVRSAWGRKSQSTTSASVKVEGAKNMFQALGGEHTSPILEKAEIEAAAPEKFEVEKTPTEVIEEAVKEFKESLSPMELLSDVSDIDDPGMLKLLVSKLVYFLVERNASNSLKIFTVFESLFFYESALYDTQILIDGFKDFLVAFEEDRYDFPKAFENMAAVFIPAVEKGYLSFENLCEISEPLQNYKGRIPTRPQFAKDLFGGLSTEVEIVEFIITCQFDLKPFFCVDGKAECDEQALKTWIKNTIAKSNKAIAILESVISPVVRNTFELSGTAPTLMHSYRWFNPDADDSLVSHEKFGVWFITSLVKVVAQKCIPGCEKSQEVFRTMEQEMVKLKPLFALNSLTDTIEHRLDILIGTEQYLKSANKLVYLEDFFWIYYHTLDLFSEEVFDIYQKTGDQAALVLLAGWFKHIEKQKETN